MVIRIATEADAITIHELHSRSVRKLWLSQYTESQIENWIAGRTPAGYLPAISREEMFVAADGSRLLGFGHAVPGLIKAVYVAPEMVRRGVGAALLKRAIEAAGAGDSEEVLLLSTLNAEGFYLRFGFEVVERKSVHKPEVSLPVVVMRLPLPAD